MTQELVDRQAIADLIHRYCIHVDGNEPEQLDVLFFEDCVTDYGPGLGGPLQGREALVKTLSTGLAHVEATHHQVSNILLTFETPDRVTGVSYVTAWHRFPGSTPDLTVFAQYHDVFERREGRWGSAERKIVVAGDTGSPLDWNPLERR